MIPNDPAILLSFINTKLRDEYASLDDLCEDMNLEKMSLITKLEAVDYRYDKKMNKFV